jgi:hypothetical protein
MVFAAFLSAYPPDLTYLRTVNIDGLLRVLASVNLLFKYLVIRSSKCLLRLPVGAVVYRDMGGGFACFRACY